MEETNKQLLKIAEKRVGFKKHLTIYILLNLGFWLIWLISSYIHGDGYLHPWPLYPMFGWGIGITFHYLTVYKWNEKWVEKEYQSLLKEKKEQ